MNLLNRKIQAVKHTIARLKTMEALTTSSGEKTRIKQNIKELNTILEELLEQATDN